jgi:disulfide oxidoreductase YuzD
MEIHVTTDYNDFKGIVSNREVNKSHVRKLAESIRKKNLLFIRPVIVNEKMQVIDGQHRLAACELLGAPVHYILCPELTKEDIAILNTAQKNWTRLDFINFCALEGIAEFKELSKLINKYPELKVSFILRAIGNCKDLRHGVIKLIDTEFVHQLCEWLQGLYKKKYEFVASRDFGVACLELGPEPARL